VHDGNHARRAPRSRKLKLQLKGDTLKVKLKIKHDPKTPRSRTKHPRNGPPSKLQSILLTLWRRFVGRIRLPVDGQPNPPGLPEPGEAEER
ncbi:MAG: hypothetical protein AAF492_10560, partial [Verrucomicrobiota bacterium]